MLSVMLMVIMSRILSELLEAKEPLFTQSIKQLEEASGSPGVDIRLSAEISSKVQHKLKELGLDHKDTTGKELYFGLQGIVKIHDGFLAKAIGATDPADVQELLPKILAKVRSLDMPKSCWVLKYSVAKKLLKDMPPKHVMKHLGYKSIDSMLKREKIAEIYGALRFGESHEWLERFIKGYKHLSSSDFEKRDIEITMMDAKKWGTMTQSFVEEKKHNITHLKELGVIYILPIPIRQMQGITITILPLLIHYINEIRLYSAYFKFQQVRPHFGGILVDTLISDPAHHAVMAGTHIHWRVLQRYYGRLKHNEHPEIFEPHVQSEDIHWRKAEEILYHIEPALKFWEDMDYVGQVYDGAPLSFNLMDNVLSYCNSLEYDERVTFHFRESLWNELMARYLGQENLEREVLKQLDNDVLEPELLLTNGKRGFKA